jgi:hypothetical protein
MALLTIDNDSLVCPTASSSMVSPRRKGQRNAYLGPFGNVPADILYDIAQYAGPLPNLVLVCKRWADIILFSPFLWRDIHITFPRSVPPSGPNPDQLARAALRRAGCTTGISLHLEIYELNRNLASLTVVLGVVKARGHQHIRRLKLSGIWSSFDSLLAESCLFSSLAGEWTSLLHLEVAVLSLDSWRVKSAISPWLDCVLATAPELQHIRIPAYLVSLNEKRLSRKRTLINLDISRSPSYPEGPRFSVWQGITSLKSQATSGYNSPIGNNFDLRSTDPPSDAGPTLAFPSLTHAEFINHTLDFRCIHRLESLTDLVLRYVDIEANAPRSVEMPSLRNLVADRTHGIDSIIAPVLETLSIGPLRGVDVAEYLSQVFSGHPQQLDPVHLDLRPVYTGRDGNFIRATVPLASVSSLRRVERISIARLAMVQKKDLQKYRVFQSTDIDVTDGEGTKVMTVLPNWREIDLDEDDVPDWLLDIITARRASGFPVQLNLDHELRLVPLLQMTEI